MKTNQMLCINDARKNKVRLIRFGSIVLVMVCMMSMFTGVVFADGANSVKDYLTKIHGFAKEWITPLMGIGVAAAALAFVGVSIAKLMTSSQQNTDRYTQWQKRILIALVCIVGVTFIFNFVLGLVKDVSGTDLGTVPNWSPDK